MLPASGGYRRTTTLANLQVGMYYIGVPEYKALHEPTRRLGDLEEARGQLLRVFEAEGEAVACFSWGAVALPFDLRDELRELVGREIAILRLDGYRVRGLDSD